MKILELFSSYGTASFALKRLGIPHQIVGYSDIDKYANQCFRQNHLDNIVPTLLQFFNQKYGELGDVKQIDPKLLIDFDLLTGGFPCQAFSNAGKMQGELDPRGSLFYEIIRIAEVKKPKYMLLENVKGLTCKKFESTFNKILSELDRIGYNVYWKVLNSKDYGIPQSRARVWFVCFRKDIDKGFEFPKPVELKIFVKDILEDDVEQKYFLSEKVIKRLFNSDDLINKFSIINPEIAISEVARQYANWKGNFIVAMRSCPRTGRNNENRIQSIEPRFDGCSNSITSVQKDNLVMNCIGTCFGRRGTSQEERDMYKKVLLSSGQLRRLTPKECFRLMGFLNDEINLEGLSDTQRYKLAGNGQDVNMVSLIFKEMFK